MHHFSSILLDCFKSNLLIPFGYVSPVAGDSLLLFVKSDEWRSLRTPNKRS